MQNTHIINAKSYILDGFVFIFIVRGTVKITISDETYELKEGDIFGCNPQDILEDSLIFDDIDIRGIFFDTKYIERIANYLALDWSYLMMVKAHEILHATPMDMESLCKYYDLINDRIQSEDSINKERSLDALVFSFTYLLFDIRDRNQEKVEPNVSYSSTDKIFINFLKIIDTPGEKFKTVNEYADMLNITPKYFSSVCKRISGKTASTIINERVMQQAMMMLRNKRYNIKQIASLLGFKNPSHFGCFFRRYTGVSPQRFRQSKRNNISK